VPTTPEQGSNNEQLIANAMNDLLAGGSDENPAPVQNNPAEVSPQNPEAAPAAADAGNDAQTPPQAADVSGPTEPQADQPADPNIGSQHIPGRKVVRPIENDNAKPDLSELVAKEEVKENIEKGM